MRSVKVLRAEAQEAAYRVDNPDAEVAPIPLAPNAPTEPSAPRAKPARVQSRRARAKRDRRVDIQGAAGYDKVMTKPEPVVADDGALKRAMGRAIAHGRIQAGFETQASFARAIDVRFQYMSRVEKGEENLTLETLAKMTGVMRIAMPDFLARVAEEMRNTTEPPKSRRGRPPAA